MSVVESLLFATGNAHKLREVGQILAGVSMSVHGLDWLASVPAEPEETGRTFIANAVLKAQYYARHAQQLTLAEDSGLEVDALEGEPGVRSARFAGASGPREIVDRANNDLLLRRLAEVADAARTARFVCAMAVCDARRTWAVVRGTVEGVILREPRGSHGFGYDPLFFVPAEHATTAELPPERKNAISHRGEASRKMASTLRLLLDRAR